MARFVLCTPAEDYGTALAHLSACLDQEAEEQLERERGAVRARLVSAISQV